MPRQIIFGDIDGYDEGHLFQGRREMMPSGFHRSWGRGIDSDKELGAAAVVLSGGYKDEDDHDVIIYTGAGGRDSKGKQIKNQDWNHNDNKGLMISCDRGIPVRVIIGHKHKSPLSPGSGYVYAGLYYVESYWDELVSFGDHEFIMCKFKLVYSGNNPARILKREAILDHGIRDKKRHQGTVVRVVRDTSLARTVKELYNYECQVCGTMIKTKGGYYAEGAHIRPLGKPHNGDDSLRNLLCLCPNHHVMFDKGVFTVNDNFQILGDVQENTLTVKEAHKIDLGNFEYHRKIHGYD